MDISIRNSDNNVIYNYTADVRELLKRMIDSQVTEELAHLFAVEINKSLRTQSVTSAVEALEQLIINKIGRPEPIIHKNLTKIIIVLGLSGVGKTTTISKLSHFFSNIQKKKVGIINTNTYGVCAHELIERYTDILGIPLQTVYMADEIENALAEANTLVAPLVEPNKKPIDYELNFEQFLSSIQMEYRGKLDSATFQQINEIAQETRVKIESQAQKAKFSISNYYVERMMELIRNIVDLKMNAGFGDNSSSLTEGSPDNLASMFR